MWTKFAISSNYSAERIADELLCDLPQLDPQKTICFLNCVPGIDHSSLLTLLSKKTTLPIIGGTTLPFLYDESNVSMSILSNETIRHNIQLSEPLVPEGANETIDRLYERCVAGLGEPPKLFITIMPVLEGLRVDIYLKRLFELAGDVPVVGGMSSYDFDTIQNARVFAFGEAYSDRMVLLAIGGGIKPVFKASCNLTVLSDYKPRITEVHDNVIVRVDDMPFCEYLRNLGFEPEEMEAGTYGPMTVLVYGESIKKDGLPQALELVKTNTGEGSGTVSAGVKQGDRISMAFLSRQNIYMSAKNAVNSILNDIKINEIQGYKYSFVFCVACITRYFAMSGHEDLEREYFLQHIPKDVAVHGYYGANEICPTVCKDGTILNRTHGNSIIICAF